ncbi:MAG: PAS domain S-box protein [Gemmatimonadetes bacterium]|nr:PAS domain S-box protein [Gemmatimonadota bacterium]
MSLSENSRNDASSPFHAILQAAVEAIVVSDKAGRIRVFSPGAERLFGYSEEEVMGRNVHLLMPEPHHSAHDGYLRNYLTTGEKKIIGIGREVIARKKDGSIFPIELSIGEIENSPDENRFVAIIRDITNRRHLEDVIHQKSEELRMTFEGTPLGIATLDMNGRLLSPNGAFCRIVHMKEKDLAGQAILDLVHEDDRPQCESHLTMLQSSRGSDSFSAPIQIRNSRGETVHVILHCGVVRDSSGLPLQIVIQLEDRTEVEAAEDEARDMRERLAHVGRMNLMSEMASGIAHEINQPLASIATYASACLRFIEQDEIDRDLLKETLIDAEKEARRAGGIVHRLRDLVRKRPSRLETAPVNQLVHEAIVLCRSDANQMDVAIVGDVEPGIPDVTADTIQIQQVLLNLIRNAIDATKAAADSDTANNGDRTIRVKATRSGQNAVLFAVTDRGAGITEEEERRLFELFFTTKSKGMGMGLSISRTIVESHGGIMSYERNKNGGATFRFTLPIGGRT